MRIVEMLNKTSFAYRKRHILISFLNRLLCRGSKLGHMSTTNVSWLNIDYGLCRQAAARYDLTIQAAAWALSLRRRFVSGCGYWRQWHDFGLGGSFLRPVCVCSEAVPYGWCFIVFSIQCAIFERWSDLTVVSKQFPCTSSFTSKINY